MLAALVSGPIVILGLIALASMLLRIEVKIDLAMLGFAIALTVMAVTVHAVIRYRLEPKKAVTVGYNYKLVQPFLPRGRYTFSLEVFYEHDIKGERRHSRQALIEMKFKKNDHPDLLEWCCGQISGQLAKHGELAAARFPSAQIVLGPEPTPQELAAHVETVERPDPPVEEGQGDEPRRFPE